MNLRQRLLLIIGVPIVGLLLIFVFLFLRNRQTEMVSDVQQDFENTQNVPIQNDIKEDDFTILDGSAGVRDDLETIEIPTNEEDKNRLYVRQLSKIFTERLFTYSNQANNSHIEDASLMATEKMKKYLRTLAVEQGTTYEGMNTAVFNVEIVDFSENSATVTISVVQEKMSKETSEKSQKSGKIIFIKESNGTWLVDGLFWD